MKTFYKPVFCFLLLFFLASSELSAQSSSVAKKWNEALIEAIKDDFARPTVHARNLFHASVAMYDAWAVYDDTASTYFLNHTFRQYYCPFDGIEKPENVKKAQEEAISYAAYRLLTHRFKDSPGARESLNRFNSLFRELRYDASFTSTDYSSGSPAALGNYIAERLIEFGMQDGANEARQYQNTHYLPVNPPLYPFGQGNPRILDPNRWQPLELENFVDQGGVALDGGPPPFLSPEWGKVVPFALKKEDLKVYTKKGQKYWVYHDPGPPPLLNLHTGEIDEEYLWTFSLVSIWGSHLDPTDEVMMDISPASIGSIQKFPASPEEFHEFYTESGEGAKGTGYELNPRTGEPYEPQWVRRGDYTRVLAEFWADGPNSETPPGHWFSILNYVNSHPLAEKKMGGKGQSLDDLEWDVKSYLVLGGAVHDAAIAAWGVKGYYDYIRPISAIRAMADRGQSSDPALPSYHPAGIPLKNGYVELIKAGDPLAGFYGENINKIKLYTWRGISFFGSEQENQAGVGWIPAELWWPYQRPTFVTPPFAGYVSGHSTFSRSAAEALTLLTGDEFFPGGLSQFWIRKNQYHDFELSPSSPLVLQWATYRDAADQCSLSRIWGGIHPPADDIPGRIMGQKIGVGAFHYASDYFNGLVAPEPNPERKVAFFAYPNPLEIFSTLTVKMEPVIQEGTLQLVNLLGQVIWVKTLVNNVDELIEVNTEKLPGGIYFLILEGKDLKITEKIMVK